MGCIEIVQHPLAFRVWQHGQRVGCLRRGVFQRVDQRVQRRQEHLTHPFGTDARVDLNIKAKVFAAVVIDRKVDRVIGAFLTEQNVHTVDARALRGIQLLTAAVVAVIEQAGEQRTLGINAAVLLNFSQRGVFKTQ